MCIGLWGRGLWGDGGGKRSATSGRGMRGSSSTVRWCRRRIMPVLQGIRGEVPGGYVVVGCAVALSVLHAFVSILGLNWVPCV
jgi:hypothetical protein